MSMLENISLNAMSRIKIDLENVQNLEIECRYFNIYIYMYYKDILYYQ